MIRDLVEIAIDMVRNEKLEEVEEKAEMNAEERILDLLLPPQQAVREINEENVKVVNDQWTAHARESFGNSCTTESSTSGWWRLKSRNGISLPSKSSPTRESRRWISISRIFLPGFLGQRTKKRNMKVEEAMDYLVQEEEQKLVDMDQVTRTAVERVEDSGIIFSMRSTRSPDAKPVTVLMSAAREFSAIFFPSLKGTTVNTRYGMVRTDHILFHCGRRVSCEQTRGLDSGIAGPVSHTS
jgi:ATP-dependent HslUV protease ATP-binding subunit HslU